MPKAFRPGFAEQARELLIVVLCIVGLATVAQGIYHFIGWLLKLAGITQ